MLDSAGVAVPQEMQGRSWQPLAEGRRPADWRDAFYYHYHEYPHGWHSLRPHYGVRTDRYRLMRFHGEVNFRGLYDLETNPHELVNRFADPEYAAVREQLQQRLAELQQELGDEVNDG